MHGVAGPTVLFQVTSYLSLLVLDKSKWLRYNTHKLEYATTHR